ncbi:MAG TPA: glycosyltransferase family 4 protein [Candidatus Thermoplasmatota archaeon]|nr:glycosyltransferase family 4 protein [Candidatus Thermoplasmatota archaeon]
MAQPRILVVSPYYAPESTGCASRVSDLAERWAAAGARVTVLAPHPSFPPGAFPRSWRLSGRRALNGVEVVNLAAWQPGREAGFASRVAGYVSFPLHASLRLLVAGRRYDAVFVTMPPVFTAWAGLVMKRLHGKPLVLDVRDLWVDAAVDLGFVREDAVATRATRRLEARALAAADRVAVVTPRLGERLVERHPDVAGKLLDAPNGVDTRRFTPGAPTGRRFVYAGLLGPAQDLDTMIEGFARIADRYPDVRLDIAGEGEERVRLEALAKARGLAGRVRFHGLVPREGIPTLVASSVAALAPIRDRASLDYAIPTKAYEAMACGVPFIGLGRGEIRRLAEETRAGLVPDADADEVARAMASLLDDENRRAEMGKRGRAWVEERGDRSAVAARLLAVMVDLAEGSA